MQVNEFNALASIYINSIQACIFDSVDNQDRCLRSQIEFQNNIIHVTSSWYRKKVSENYQYLATLEDDLLETDPSTLSNSDNWADILITVKTDILLHPIYGIPCPYITGMWTDTGRLLSIEEAQVLIDELNSSRTCCIASAMSGQEKYETDQDHFPTKEPPHSTTTTMATDHRQYTMGRLTMEIHPVADTPCWSLHICQLTDIMELRYLNNRGSVTSTTVDHIQQDNVDVGVGIFSDSLYLLNWFTVIGPYFAYKLSPAMYNKLVQLINSNTNTT